MALNPPSDVCLFINNCLKWSPVPCADYYNIHFGDAISALYVGTVRVDAENADQTQEVFVDELENWPMVPADVNSGSWSVSAGINCADDSCDSIRSLPAIDKPFLLGQIENGSTLFFDDFKTRRSDYRTNHIWHPETEFINNELQLYVDFGFETLTFGPDGAKISAYRNPAAPDRAAPGSWFSGLLSTADNMILRTDFHIEAKIRTKGGRGAWPAFWLLNRRYDNNPTENEIDIMEKLLQEPGRIYHTFHHRMPDTGQLILNAHQAISTQEDAEDWAIYGVRKRKGSIVWYLNGYPVSSFRSPHIDTEPMYAILNLAMGGNWPGPPDDSMDNASMEIEYLHAARTPAALLA